MAGATVSFDATFADGVTYIDFSGSPIVTATTHSLTISGASNPASNGTFADPDGFSYLPSAGFNGLFLDSVASFFFYRTQTIDSGLSFKFGLDLGPPPIAPVVGDFVNPTDFATTTTAFNELVAVTSDLQSPFPATYSIVGGAGGLTTSYSGSTDPAVGGPGPVIPEPSSLTLLAIGAVGVFGYGRRQRKKAA